MKKKKVIKTIIISLLTVCVAGGGVAGGIYYKNSKGVAEVVSVSSLNVGDMGDSTSSEGLVCDDAAQSVYLTDGAKVSEVYVTEGQQIKKGDKLLSYDVTSLSLSIEMKQIEIQSYENQLKTENEKLAKLKATKPVAKKTQTDDVIPDTTPDNNSNNNSNNDANDNLDDNQDDRVTYYVISDVSEAVSGSGTSDDPYIFECSSDDHVSGALLNQLKAASATAIFQADSAVSVTIYGEHLGDYDDTDELTLFLTFDTSAADAAAEAAAAEAEAAAAAQAEAQAAAEAAAAEAAAKAAEQDGVVEYTADELKNAIAEQTRSVNSTDLAKRMAEAELAELNSQLEDGIVYAKTDGIITKVCEPENAPTDGSAFLQVSGSQGFYITGTISELELATVKVGQSITATSWMDGSTYTGSITEISNVPSSGNSYYNSVNPNSSYYSYTAYIDGDTSNLKKGDYLDLSIDTTSYDTDSSVIYIEQMYIRDENGRSYVYKDVDGKLEKQQVKTGKNLWGSYLEIKSGITEDDYICFPYGVTEGEKTKITDSLY